MRRCGYIYDSFMPSISSQPACSSTACRMRSVLTTSRCGRLLSARSITRAHSEQRTYILRRSALPALVFRSTFLDSPLLGRRPPDTLRDRLNLLQLVQPLRHSLSDLAEMFH